MKIVIDDEKIIDLLETEWGYEGIGEDVRRLLIENGTPLPKGHGRLIDYDEVKRIMGGLYGFGAIGRCIDESTTIIEADKAESEDNNGKI